MIGINVYINQATQKSLIQAAALNEMSIEELASSLLRESIQERFGEISNSETQAEYPINPLGEMRPYSYLADPSEPAISPDDWEINQDF
ncbi:hypothetical protein CAL7716_026400 [Calothrix sp. PCC 7716]|nr:hypothetical protein CAL7716_026400 [Calothrix sp. PCC 7716]